MSSIVLDASALLAYLFGEPGAEKVEEHLSGAVVSAVNLAEVAAKLTALGVEPRGAREQLERLHLTLHPFDAEQAFRTGDIHGQTHTRGLSLGDRACLSLAQALGCPALTTDRAWLDVPLGVTVEVIR